MLRSIVIEGGDGVGKSTVAELAAAKFSTLEGFEGVYLRFPSDGLEGFRDFFLRQGGSRPEVENSKLVWSPAYTTNIPPITNLLNVMADFCYVYSSIPLAPDIKAIESRGNEPILVIDREMLSTVVYQIMYAFPLTRAEFDSVQEQKVYLLDTLRAITQGPEAIQWQHSMLVHVMPAGGDIRMTGDDRFDNYDQPLLQHLFKQLFDKLSNIGDSSAIDYLDTTGGLTWLSSRFNTYAEIEGFSKPAEDLANDIVTLFLENNNEA